MNLRTGRSPCLDRSLLFGDEVELKLVGLKCEVWDLMLKLRVGVELVFELSFGVGVGVDFAVMCLLLMEKKIEERDSRVLKYRTWQLPRTERDNGKPTN